jgi:hypothetical protein
MPDLQTEIFNKVLPNLNNLKFDDSDEETPMTVTAEPIALTRQAFEFIKTNPKCRGKTVLDFFTAAGHKRPVVAATVTALINTKRVERVDGALSILRDDYERPKKVAKVTAPKEKAATVTTPTFDVEKILEGLTIHQGRALYDRLKSIYGG